MRNLTWAFIERQLKLNNVHPALHSDLFRHIANVHPALHSNLFRHMANVHPALHSNLFRHIANVSKPPQEQYQNLTHAFSHVTVKIGFPVFPLFKH